MPLFGADSAANTSKSYCRPNVLIRNGQATSKSTPDLEISDRHAEENGEEKPPPASGEHGGLTGPVDDFRCCYFKTQ